MSQLEKTFIITEEQLLNLQDHYNSRTACFELIQKLSKSRGGSNESEDVAIMGNRVTYLIDKILEDVKECPAK